MAVRVILKGTELGRGLPSIPHIVQYTGPNPYATGGDPLTPAMLGLTEIHFVDVTGAGGYIVEYDYTNQKVKFYRQTAATSALIEVSNGVDVSAGVMRALVFGK